ncbi:heme ABC transporter ATP-binding protein [Pseudodesulfovibrio cashew]|uniref:Heme ABC transporter ATP-binding protein n=1 Tax=Pseudodesulfovibrio cashew TaxID=2678688 RepID=A0A6I6JK83_9BACT|nr:heme ABC transporter ATP-binding protein [Pseudodesulfovibrio cashew]QGY40722.1 heme ABC transporter ATP-binding protein [Pseudodesulfovibrio cashew]
MDRTTYVLRDLTFGYGREPVLHGVDLDLKPGELHGIVGPNGSGKSTLLDLLAGYRSPSQGMVELNGQPVTAYSPKELAMLTALVEQTPRAAFPFTVADTVLMGRHPHMERFSPPDEQDRNAVRDALTAMDLTGLADRPLTELSGGERQRTVFARALAQDTPCLLLDEPTSSMDIRHALAVMAVLRRLAESGRTIVAVLHDLNLAAAHCDRVTVLDKGRVHASGAPTQVLTPKNISRVFDVDARVLTCGQAITLVYQSKESS